MIKIKNKKTKNNKGVSIMNNEEQKIKAEKRKPDECCGKTACCTPDEAPLESQKNKGE